MDIRLFVSSLQNTCHGGVNAPSYDLVSVCLKMEYVKRYKEADKWTVLSDMDCYELKKHIAPLITTNDTDEYAKRFDNFMYGLMLANMNDLPT